MRTATESFPLSELHLRRQCLGNLGSMMKALAERFQAGADEVLYLEEDFIVRRDIFLHIGRTPRLGFFFTMTGTGQGLQMGYRSLGNIIGFRAFEQLRQWVEALEYVGRERPLRGVRFRNQVSGHDGVFNAFLVATGFMTQYSDRCYVGHFGVSGKNQPKDDPEVQELERRMFAGDRDQWLGNVARIIETQDYSKRMAKAFVPKRFVYGW